MDMRLGWRGDNQETSVCGTGGGVVRVQREIKEEAGQRQVAGKLDCLINCFWLLWNLWELRKVLGKRNFVTSLASVPGTDWSRDWKQ